MNIKFKLTKIILIFTFLSTIAYGQSKWNSEQKQVIGTINLLSETTATDGNGADEYSSYLSDNFSRWTIGSSITNNKKNGFKELENGLMMDGVFQKESNRFLKF